MTSVVKELNFVSTLGITEKYFIVNEKYKNISDWVKQYIAKSEFSKIFVVL